MNSATRGDRAELRSRRRLMSVHAACARARARARGSASRERGCAPASSDQSTRTPSCAPHRSTSSSSSWWWGGCGAFGRRRPARHADGGRRPASPMLPPASRIIRHASSLLVVAMTYLQLARRKYSHSPQRRASTPPEGGRGLPVVKVHIWGPGTLQNLGTLL